MQQPHPIIQSFIEYLTFEKRYSKHTIISYRTDLVSFFNYIIKTYGETPLSELSHSYIRSWLASLKDKKLTSKTINRKISSLKSFFKYQVKNGVVNQNPLLKIVAPKNEKRLPNFVADTDIKTLLKYVEFPDSWQGRTDRLLINLFYNTGMRLSEALNLKSTQINYATYSLKVLGKGNKERIIPISADLMNEIREYSNEKIKKFSGDEGDILLKNEKGKPLTARSVYTIIKHYLSLVTTIEKRSPHVLRHTFATHLMNNGAGLNAVKELLGHNSLAATQVYTHNTIEKLKDVHKKAHPKA